MKVVVQPIRIQIEISGKCFEASEQEARELWVKLNVHFGAKDATPLGGITIQPCGMYPPIWHPDSPLRVTCEQTQVPPGISVG